MDQEDGHIRSCESGHLQPVRTADSWAPPRPLSQSGEWRPGNALTQLPRGSDVRSSCQSLSVSIVGPEGSGEGAALSGGSSSTHTFASKPSGSALVHVHIGILKTRARARKCGMLPCPSPNGQTAATPPARQSQERPGRAGPQLAGCAVGGRSRARAPAASCCSWWGPVVLLGASLSFLK